MIAIGSDHGGFELKRVICEHLRGRGTQLVDCGCSDTTAVDYPDIAREVAVRVSSGDAECGILICTSGVGMSIVANKYSGVRAALIHEVTSARLCRQHNDANVLALGGGFIGPNLAREIVDVFLSTGFDGGRHARRVEKIAGVEADASARRTAMPTKDEK